MRIVEESKSGRTTKERNVAASQTPESRRKTAPGRKDMASNAHTEKGREEVPDLWGEEKESGRTSADIKEGYRQASAQRWRAEEEEGLVSRLSRRGDRVMYIGTGWQAGSPDDAETGTGCLGVSEGPGWSTSQGLRSDLGWGTVPRVVEVEASSMLEVSGGQDKEEGRQGGERAQDKGL
jgi:hypothetical protein